MDMGKYVGNTFLKVEDIRASGPVQLKIADVAEGKFGKPDLHFDDGSILSLNATNGRTLVRAYGAESDDWIGKQVELALGEIQYQGKPQEAILVKPVSPPIENKAPPKPKAKPDFNDDVPF